jgi:hypothetical protein|tara:strand:+ start:92 stop:427 length:336 start_codon:yes stop_codon:yes gene_type:complete
MRELRQLIRYILISESHHENDRDKDKSVDPDQEDRDEDLLLEPDSAREGDREVEEMNTLGGGAVRGVTTPLGTGPTYPDEPASKKKKKGKKKPRKRPVVVSKAFGGGNFSN